MLEHQLEKDGYKDMTVGALQQKMLYVKYERTKWKADGCLNSGNYPMYKIYEKQLDTIKMTLSILGIHIKGINI